MAIEKICDITECTGCGTCVLVCPHRAVYMGENEEGFRYPQIDSNKCVACGFCKKKCPVLQEAEKHAAKFYMAWHRDRNVLRTSSSGGVFTALAHYVFRRNGVVFGALRDQESWEIYHAGAENDEDLAPLKLSKYYQSDAAKVFEQVKDLLENERWVLFTGTACQIAGLYSFLGKTPRDKLITADVLCHGVASKKVVDAYIKSMEKRFRKQVTGYDFRVKDQKIGWHSGGGTRMKIKFSDGSCFVNENGTDTFFFGFNHNYFLRESCYRCHYCGTDRISDFTIGDFWGVRPEMLPDNQLLYGVSLMLCNTNRAFDMLEELQQELVVEEIGQELAVQHNRALKSPQPRPAIRDRFFSELETRLYNAIIIDSNRGFFLKQKVKTVLKDILPEGVIRQIGKICKHRKE